MSDKTLREQLEEIWDRLVKKEKKKAEGPGVSAPEAAKKIKDKKLRDLEYLDKV